MSNFLIEDIVHADIVEGGFESFDAALERLKSISAIPWGEHPNCSPCSNPDCPREYVIYEHTQPTTFEPLVIVSKSGVKWTDELDKQMNDVYEKGKVFNCSCYDGHKVEVAVDDGNIWLKMGNDEVVMDLEESKRFLEYIATVVHSPATG